MARPTKKTPPAKVHQLPVRFTEDLSKIGESTTPEKPQPPVSAYRRSDVDESPTI